MLPDEPTTKTALGSLVTVSQHAMWQIYLDIFKKRWRMDDHCCEFTAIVGADIFEAEFKERGAIAYAESVALPVRNAFYQMFMLPVRWARLREMGMANPILDYGCGCGMLLIWLWSKGYENLYGYEPPGIQREIMGAAFKGRSIGIWDEKTPDHFSTITCINVLEHVADPVGLLEKLFRLGNRVIADVCIDEDDKLQEPHIAPKDDLRECRDMLRKHGTLYTAEPHERKLETQFYGP